jgi:hypothetical protein
LFSHSRHRLRSWLFSQSSWPAFCMHLLACCMILYSSPAFVNSHIARGRSHLSNPAYKSAFEASDHGAGQPARTRGNKWGFTTEVPRKEPVIAAIPYFC